MKYRKFKDLEISALGFGAMRLPVLDGDSGKIDEPEAERMIHYAIDHGVNYVDTAWPYHKGESEPFVGRALKGGWREKINLATKLPTWMSKTREDCDKYLNDQLNRLQTEHLDFYLLHALNGGRWPKLMEIGVLDFLDVAKKDGRIRFAGFSFHGKTEEFPVIIDSYGWDFCQIQYNFMDENYQAGTAGLMYAASKGIPVIAMEPLRGGKLTKRLPEDIQDALMESGINRSPADLALRWVWNHPQIMCVLSGMTAMEQVVENCRIADESEPGSLTVAELDMIGTIKEMLVQRTVVPCTGCEYCMPCPEGVAVAEILSVYNDMNIYNDHEGARGFYGWIKPESRADKCVACGQCEEKCPQSIPIVETLKKANEALTGNGK